MLKYNKAQKLQSGGWNKAIKELKESYNKNVGFGLWPAVAKTKADAIAQHDEKVFKAMAAQLNVLEQTIKSMGAGKTPESATPGKAAGPRRTPPKEGEPTKKLVDGVWNEWCSKCRYWTFGDKQHNGDTHISRPRTDAKPAVAAVPAANPNAPSDGKVKLALNGGVTFTDDTRGGAHVAAGNVSIFPARSRLQIGGMFVASAGTTSIPCPPPSPLDTEDALYCVTIQDSVMTFEPILGTCESCGTQGPEGTPCVACSEPECRYVVQHCGPCVLCGDYGPTGFVCNECGSEDGGEYGFESSSPTHVDPTLNVTSPVAPEASTTHREWTDAEKKQMDDFFGNHDDYNEADDEDAASFKSAVSRASSSSDMRV